jgi:hypothetical protein
MLRSLCCFIGVVGQKAAIPVDWPEIRTAVADEDVPTGSVIEGAPKAGVDLPGPEAMGDQRRRGECRQTKNLDGVIKVVEYVLQALGRSGVIPLIERCQRKERSLQWEIVRARCVYQ